MARIEIRDAMGRPHGIDTQDTEILAKWMIERMEVIQPSDVFPVQLRIYPEIVDGKSDFPFKGPFQKYPNQFVTNIVSINDLIDILKNHAEPVLPDCGG